MSSHHQSPAATALGTPLSGDPSRLDEAFERLAHAGFELPNGFVNHGPMACEALATLGLDDELDPWARRFARIAGPGVDPVAPRDFDWRAALGDRRRLPEWIGYFEREIEDRGGAEVVATWAPRLMAALAAVLFHGAIRVAHASRALDASDTAPRRSELARALALWASRYQSGVAPYRPAPEDDRNGEEHAGGGDQQAAVVAAAAGAARHYLDRPGILELHGVTGAMAVELLAPHLAAVPGALAASLAQVRAEHGRMYGDAGTVTRAEPSGRSTEELVTLAAASRDPHQVKLVEACLRGHAAGADPAFLAAAETVVGAA